MKSRSAAYAATMFVLAALVFTACSSEDGPVTPDSSPETTGTTTLMKVGRNHVWAGCELYRTVVTPASFSPNSAAFDELYNIGPAGGSFKDGYVLISDASPGNTNYNGGRWHLNLLKSGVDPAKYANACSVDDLDLSDFMSTDVYFECPLQPINSRRP